MGYDAQDWQKLYKDRLPSSAGSVSEVRELDVTRVENMMLTPTVTAQKTQ